MPIPAADLAIITGAQSDLAAIKTRMGNLIAASDAMYDLKTGDGIARAACLDAKGGARELLGLVEKYHASLSRQLIQYYGADGATFVAQGGGGRR